MANLYSFRNYLSVGVHYAGAAGAAALAVTFGQPWALITAAVITIPMTVINLRRDKNLYENYLLEHKSVHPFSPNLGRTAKELYARAGLSSDRFPIYDFAIDEKKAKVEEGTSDKVFGMLRRIPNAAAVNLGKPVIMISESLLKLLDDDEEKAVLAHEFAHVAAKHHATTFPQELTGKLARRTMTLTLMGASLSIGVWNFVGVILGAGILGSIIARKMQSPRTRAVNDNDARPWQKAEKLKATRIGTTFSAVSGLALLSILNPAIPALWLASVTTGKSTKLLSKTFSRSCEYQADKGAVALGADPLSLITSLRKIQFLYDQAREKNMGAQRPNEQGWLKKTWDKLHATHPTSENRYARLADIARKNGSPEAAINFALKSPINIDQDNNISYGVIKVVAKRLN